MKKTTARSPQKAEPSRNRAPKFIRYAWGRRKTKPRPALVEGLLYPRSLCILYGRTASMKSFVVRDIAAAVATGNSCFGRRTTEGAVFLILGEGNDGWERRLRVYEQENDCSLKSLWLTRRGAELSDAAVARALSDRIARIAKKRQIKPALVVIDPLARAAGFIDENSASDMSRLVDNIDRNFRRRFSCAVLVVHHAGYGKDVHMRGSSALPAAADTVLLVTYKEGHVSIKCEKQKDERPADPIHLKPKPVVVVAGEPASLALDLIDPPMKKADRALMLLKELASTHRDGRVMATHWCAAAIEQEICSNKKSFDKTKGRLKEQGRVMVDGRFVTVC